MSVPDTPSYIIRGEPKFPAEVENRSRTPFTTFPLPPGLYMAIAHNGPLRRRIQDHSGELEEFVAHVTCPTRAKAPSWMVGHLVPSHNGCGTTCPGMYRRFHVVEGRSYSILNGAYPRLV